MYGNKGWLSYLPMPHGDGHKILTCLAKIALSFFYTFFMSLLLIKYVVYDLETDTYLLFHKNYALKKNSQNNRTSKLQNRSILTASLNFVLMTPGATQLTRILSPASCGTSARVSPSKAVLLTLYGPKNWDKNGSLFRYAYSHDVCFGYDAKGMFWK